VIYRTHRSDKVSEEALGAHFFVDWNLHLLRSECRCSERNVVDQHPMDGYRQPAITQGVGTSEIGQTTPPGPEIDLLIIRALPLPTWR